MADSFLEVSNDSPSAIQAPMTEPEPLQRPGWASPTVPDSAEICPGRASDVLFASGFAVEGQRARPSDQSLAWENACLKGLVDNMNTRIGNLAAALAAKTSPKQAQTTPPRKRTASCEDDISASPSKKTCPLTPTPSRNIPGPIEAMWSPGVTPEQRRAMYDSGIGFSTPTPLPTSSPAASSSTSSTPKKPRTPAQRRTPAPKKAPAQKKSPAPKKVPKKSKKAQTQGQSTGSTPSTIDLTGIDLTTVDIDAFSDPQERPEDKLSIKELYSANFMSLTVSDKARLLLPLLRGIDPATGQRNAQPGTLGLQMQAPNTSAMAKAPLTEHAVDQTTLVNDPAFDTWLLTLQPESTPPVSQQSAIEFNATSSLQRLPTVENPFAQAEVLDAASVNSLLTYISEDTATFPEDSSSTTTPNIGYLSPASSPYATNTAAYDNSQYLDDIPVASFEQDAIGDNLQVEVEYPYMDFLAIPVAHSNAQNSTADTSHDLTGDSFHDFAATMPLADFDAQHPMATNSHDLAWNNFDEFTIEDNGNMSTLNGAKDNGVLPAMDFNNGGIFYDNPFTTDANTTPDDLDVGLQLAHDAAEYISSPECGAKRQRKALEEHQRRVAEGRRR
ncbi:hypothetical protein DE146DRAFT_187721 [Phaeosphaeria sp. MPI-PUGE-AT-0046c]|nr:hypothetical protein DE146DRAFT_187721 [Phaeosphaeria sp. MPI-PUGE-AT-0046c]